MKKVLVIIGVSVFIVGGYFVFVRNTSTDTNSDNDQTTTDNSSNASDSSSSDPKFIKIAAMGDMLPHDTVNLRAETDSGYDYLPYFSEVNRFIEDSDIVFCNQESPSAGESYGISGYPTFNAPTEFSRDLNKFGCNTINLANNHVADKGQPGIDETLATWDELDTLAVAGANSSASQQNTISYFEVKGKKIAFIAFTDLSNNSAINSYSINMFSNDLVTRLAKEASTNADYVIASAHWGMEDSDVSTQSQRAWAELLANNGVDLIIGTGPHVLQTVEKIGDTVVFYSIGNFLSSQLTIEQLTGGIAFVKVPLDGGDPELSFLPTYMSYTWSANDAATENLLARDNLKLYPLDQAANLIEASLFNTSAQQQLDRIEALLNSATKVEILTSN